MMKIIFVNLQAWYLFKILITDTEHLFSQNLSVATSNQLRPAILDKIFGD